MSSLKDRVNKIRSLEAEKRSLLADIEELKKMADAKANALANEIASLRADINSLKVLMGAEKQKQPKNDYLKEPSLDVEKPQQPSNNYLKRQNAEIEKPPPPPMDIPKMQNVEVEKPQETKNDFQKEQNIIARKELVEKTLDASNKLGSEVFAVPPFDQYFDDWLVNLRLIVSQFESNSAIKVDEQFVKERAQIFEDVESALAQKKVEESKIEAVAKSMADNNNLLVETDKEYAEKTKALTLKKEHDTEPLLYRIRELMSDVKIQEDSKNKIFKKKTADKLAQTKKDLQSSETELEKMQSKFTAEQDALREKYEKKKQELTAEVESLHKELEKLETDMSIEARQAASNALANAINALVQRNPMAD
jgi:hypothetical protein